MAILSHLLLVVVYAAASVAVAVFVPRLAPTVGTTFPLDYVALSLAGFAMLHAAVTGVRARFTIRREAAEVRRAHAEVMRELDTARAEVRQIHEAIQQSAVGGARSKAMREVVNEVKVLKGLIERLAAGRPQQPVNVAAEAGPPPPPPPGTVVSGLDDTEILDFVRRGLETNRVDLYLQPVVALPQRKRRYFECFSRIRDAQGDMLLPERYIPVAQQAGLTAVIDNMLLFRCVQLVRKTQMQKRNVGFFCNISAHTLGDAVFFPEFIAFMAENPALATALYFEFSQADVADLPPAAEENLMRLGDMGFRFSLDRVSRLDMNYGELSRRYFRFIKVDAQDLIGYLRDLEDQGVLAAFQAEVESAGIDIVAEKIEDETTLVEVLDYRIDYGQGYLFGEPRPARQA